MAPLICLDSVRDPKAEVHRTQLELKITRIPATSGNQIQQLHFSTSFAMAEGKRNRKRFVFSTEKTDEGRKQEKPELKKPKPQESDEWDIIEAADNRCYVDHPPEGPEHELSPSRTTSSSTTPCHPTVVTFSPFTFAPRIANNYPVSKSPVVATPIPVFAPEKSIEVCQRLVQKNHPRLKLGSRMLQKPRASLGRVGIDSYDFARARHNLANHSLLLSSLLSAKNALYFAGVGSKKFFKDPYTITLGGFSKVTNFLRDAVMTPAANRPIDEYAELMSDLPSIFSVNSQAEQSYEMVVTESPLGPRPDVERRSPLTEAEWASHLDKEGRVTDVAELQRKIFRGGLVPSLRREVWKFLLKYYPWNSTSKERTVLRKLKEDEYFCMKAQWKTVTPQQEKRFSKHRDNKCIIEKDVIRTDRTHPFYMGEHNPHIEVLHDILMTYCQYNMDLGYVQGMSDLLAPILVVMEREVDAFWCLVGFLDDHGLVMNFDMEQEGMRNQLMQLNNMMQIVDPKLYGYLQSKECSNLYFCFRWLLIWFKREFTMDNISRIWEIMWTGLPCKNFHFLMCLAILDGERDLLEKENFDFSDILKHVNELSCSIDADKILQTAEAIYLQLVDYPELPDTIREVIGLSSEENGLTENGSHASESSIEVLADPSE